MATYGEDSGSFKVGGGSGATTPVPALLVAGPARKNKIKIEKKVL